MNTIDYQLAEGLLGLLEDDASVLLQNIKSSNQNLRNISEKHYLPASNRTNTLKCKLFDMKNQKDNLMHKFNKQPLPKTQSDIFMEINFDFLKKVKEIKNRRVEVEKLKKKLKEKFELILIKKQNLVNRNSLKNMLKNVDKKCKWNYFYQIRCCHEEDMNTNHQQIVYLHSLQHNFMSLQQQNQSIALEVVQLAAENRQSIVFIKQQKALISNEIGKLQNHIFHSQNQLPGLQFFRDFNNFESMILRVPSWAQCFNNNKLKQRQQEQNVAAASPYVHRMPFLLPAENVDLIESSLNKLKKYLLKMRSISPGLQSCLQVLTEILNKDREIQDSRSCEIQPVLENVNRLLLQCETMADNLRNLMDEQSKMPALNIKIST